MGERRHLERAEAGVSDRAPQALIESRLSLLTQAGTSLGTGKNLGRLVASILRTGAKLSGASVAACFYKTIGQDGHDSLLVKVSGGRASVAALLQRGAALAHARKPTRKRALTIRIGDVSHHTIAGSGLPLEDLLAAAPSQVDPSLVRSYIELPLCGQEGESLGSLQFGHSDPDVFSVDMEPLLKVLSTQLSVAIENAHLKAVLRAQQEATEASARLQSLTADRLRQALDAAGLGTFTWNRETDLLDLDARASELFHTDPRVPITRSALREHLVVPEDRELTRERLRASLDSGGTYSAEYRIAGEDGGISWLAASGLARESEQGGAEMIGVVQDITARKNQEAALRQSEKLAATGRLAASIAHEINNPLEAVTNLLFLVKTDPALPGHLEEMMQIADSELARVGQISQQTLGFYRDTSHPAELDLSALLSAVIELFSHKLGHKRLQCTLDLEPNLRLFGFAGEMRQIFSNLLVNAIDATPSGTIHLRARSHRLGENPGVVVVLSDPGSGIPSHLRKRMFSPFFTTKEFVGTGLGLWVTRGMVEKHGGKIHFRSRTEHPTGTVFRVHLPQALPENAVASATGNGVVH